jgi:hypothetical protein
MRLAEIREQLFKLVASVGEALPADGDWQPVLFAWNEQGAMAVEAVAPEYLVDEQARERFLDDVVSEFADSNDAQTLGMVATVVSHSFSPGELPSAGPSELVQLQLVDLAVHEVWYAPIDRSGTRLTLGPWQKRTGSLDPASFVSRFADRGSTLLSS